MDRVQSSSRNPDEIKRQKEFIAALAEERRRCLVHIMGTTEGRWFVWDLLDSLKVFSPVWDHSGSMMAKKSGLQEKGLTLLQSLWDTCPGEYQKMQDEYLKYRSDILKRFPPTEDSSGPIRSD